MLSTECGENAYLRMMNIVDLERETRFELATPTLARLCSTTELFPQFGVGGYSSAIRKSVNEVFVYSCIFVTHLHEINDFCHLAHKF